jgi:hypothetical protein
VKKSSKFLYEPSPIGRLKGFKAYHSIVRVIIIYEQNISENIIETKKASIIVPPQRVGPGWWVYHPEKPSALASFKNPLPRFVPLAHSRCIRATCTTPTGQFSNNTVPHRSHATLAQSKLALHLILRFKGNGSAEFSDLFTSLFSDPSNWPPEYK